MKGFRVESLILQKLESQNVIWKRFGLVCNFWNMLDLCIRIGPLRWNGFKKELDFWAWLDYDFKKAGGLVRVIF